MNRTIRKQDGSALIIVVAVIVIALVGVLGYVAYNTFSGQKTATTTQTSNGKETVKTENSSAPEAFGLKVGMTEAEVEAVVGKPLAACYVPATTTGNTDKSCSYGESSTSTANPIVVDYKNGKLVDAVQTKTEGGKTTSTILNKDGVKTY